MVSPFRALGAALALAGGVLVWLNHAAPDESRWLGVLLLALGAFLLIRQPSPLARRAGQLAAIVLLFLLGGEWAVRRENARAQAAYAESFIHLVDDPLLRYELKPHRNGTNARGMLDVERALDKPAGVYRVACVGDSVGGDQSLLRDNVCAQLERELSRLRGGPVEALNFSVPGYNTMQEARAFEQKALPFQPDALVVLYVLNDPYPELAISHLLPGHLEFAHLLAGGLRALASRWLGLDGDPFHELLAPLYRDPRAWRDVVVAGFDRLAQAAAPRKLPVVVAVFPLFTEGADARWGTIYRQVADEARRHGFLGLELSQAAYAGQPLPSLLKPSRDPIHPNAHAHALAAQAIARALVGASPAKEAP